MGFKLKVLGADIWSGTAQVVLVLLASSWGADHTNQCSDRSSSTASQDEDHRAKHIKKGYDYDESSYIPSKEPGCTVTSLSCLHANAHSMGNKQELQICAGLEGQNLIAAPETWLDSSCNWNVVIDGYAFLEETGQTAEVVDLLFKWESN